MRKFVCLAFVALMSLSANATLVQDVDLVGPGAIAGASPNAIWSYVMPGLTDNGVTFDVTWTVTGSNAAGAADVTAGTGAAPNEGLGVAGGGNDAVNEFDVLTFSFVTSNEIGGTVTGDLDTVDFGFFTAGLSGTSDTFVGGAGGNSFAQSFEATFEGVAAVPEPGSMAALAVLGLGVVVRRRRRV